MSLCRCPGLSLSRALAGAADAATVARLNDGRGEYSLAGFISHMGANTACGHYVAHVRKEGRWVIYNDEKVSMTCCPTRALRFPPSSMVARFTLAESLHLHPCMFAGDNAAVSTRHIGAYE